jgi:hypothetical protein
MLEQIFKGFLISLLGVFLLGVIGCFYMSIKCDNTYKNHLIIANAIYLYNKHLIDTGEYTEKNIVSYSDMEDYDTTLCRVWDWGYTRILPPEKLELIKPFIKSK